MAKTTIFLLLLLISLNIYGESNIVSLIPPEDELSKLQCPENHYRLSNQSTGLRTVACNLKSAINLDQMAETLGLMLFQEGSKADPFDFSSKGDFNRYNPALFLRLKRLLSERGIQPHDAILYELYFRNLIRAYYSVGMAVNNSPDFNSKYLPLYQNAIDNGEEILPGSLFQCLNLDAFYPESEKQHRKTCSMQCAKNSNMAFFWLRREMDGSANALFDLIEYLVIHYDRQYYAQVSTITANPIMECGINHICPH